MENREEELREKLVELGETVFAKYRDASSGDEAIDRLVREIRALREAESPDEPRVQGSVWKDDFTPELITPEKTDFQPVPVNSEDNIIKPEPVEDMPLPQEAAADETPVPVTEKSESEGAPAPAAEEKAPEEMPPESAAPDVCPVCGAIVYAGRKFCSSCGARILGPGEPVPPEPEAHLAMKMADARFQIRTATFQIGRTEGQLRITDSHISPLHAEILYRNGDFFLEDLNSLEHTYLNGRELTPKCPVKLFSGDEISFADIACTFTIDGNARNE